MRKTLVPLALFASLSVAVTSSGAEKPAPAVMKPVLVVMDVQNAYLPLMDERETKRGMEMINYVIALFRDNGFPVIRVYHTDPAQGPPPGSEAFEFPATVAIKDEDPKVVKNYGSAFKKTDLDKLLRERGCNTVFLVGLSAVGCVLATYHGGNDLDYTMFMVKGAVISHDTKLTGYVEEISRTIGYSALKLLLETARAR